MKKLLIITTLFLMSIGLMAGKRTLQQGELRLTASAGYQEFIPKHGDNSHIMSLMGDGVDFMGISIGGNPGYAQFMFLDSEASGLSVFYGINENMQVAISVPVFSFLTSENIDIKQTLGAAKLGFLYILPMGTFDIIINPFISSPFLQFTDMDIDSKLLSESDELDETSFKQPFGLGTTIAIEGAMDKIHWGAYLALSKYFEREREIGPFKMKYGKATYMSLAAMVGFDLNESIMIKGNIYYDLNEFEHDGDADISSFAIKGGADIALNESLDLSASFIFRKAIDSDNGKTLGVMGGVSMKF